MEISQKIKIDADSFESVSKMLTSPSEEDVATALMALEQMDFKKGQLFYAILYRDSLDKVKLWENNAPNLLKNIKAIGMDEICSYRSMWNKLKGTCSPDEKKVFAKRFGIDAVAILADWGFKDMIKDFKIIVIYNDGK